MHRVIPRDSPYLSGGPGPASLGPGQGDVSWPTRRPPAPYYQGMFGWRGEVRELIAQLEAQRTRLEQVRERATRQGGPGEASERLEAQATARLEEIEQRIADLRASLD